MQVWSAAVAVAFLPVLTPLEAQDSAGTATKKAAFWVSAGLGPGTPGGLGFAGAASLRLRSFLLRTRVGSVGQFLGSHQDDLALEVGLSRTLEPQVVAFAAGIGVSRVTGSRGCLLCGSTPAPTVMGITADAEIRLRVFSVLGFSGQVFTDRNSQQNITAALFGLYLGRF